MNSLGDAVQKTHDTLKNSGIPDARLEAELLITDLLKVPRHHLFAYQEQELTPQEKESLAGAVKRRLKREPLAYILGYKEFYDVPLVVGPAVMIPRPETELLVEHALAISRISIEDPHLVIAEPGTGCGGISINLALHLPSARIYATELSEDALKMAQLNIQKSKVTDRVTLLQGDLLKPVPEAIDLIVANLPYIRSDEIPNLSPEVQWEPRGALDGGPEGLDVISRMLNQALYKLNTGGGIILEIDPKQVEPLKELAMELFPGACIRTHKDLSHQERIFVIECR